MPESLTPRPSAAVPTLDAIAERPEAAAALTRAAVLALHAKAVRAMAALEGPLLAAIAALPPMAAQAAPTLPALFTIEEAAARINVPPSRIKAAIRSGALRSQKVGVYRRIRPEWLEEFVRAEEDR